MSEEKDQKLRSLDDKFVFNLGNINYYTSILILR